MQRGVSKLGLTEIRIAGFGGQGVILAAAVIGKAAAIFEGGYATMTQSFGPEARGGSSAAQVILSGEPILYPYVTHPDILVVMSQEAYAVFSPQLKPGGILIVEQDLVRIDHPPQGVRFYGVPATRLAEELGRKPSSVSPAPVAFHSGPGLLNFSVHEAGSSAPSPPLWSRPSPPSSIPPGTPM